MCNKYCIDFLNNFQCLMSIPHGSHGNSDIIHCTPVETMSQTGQLVDGSGMFASDNSCTRQVNISSTCPSCRGTRPSGGCLGHMPPGTFPFLNKSERCEYNISLRH